MLKTEFVEQSARGFITRLALCNDMSTWIDLTKLLNKPTRWAVKAEAAQRGLDSASLEGLPAVRFHGGQQHRPQRG
jgi:hypothetical protein